jgi:hypothetical protein
MAGPPPFGKKEKKKGEEKLNDKWELDRTNI